MKKKVIIGVTESDAHVVANILIEIMLKETYEVINLGACTSVREFANACQLHNNCSALIIGSLNGHAYDDLKSMKDAKAKGLIRCPVILGGNLSVGKEKKLGLKDTFYNIGIDIILDDIEEIIPVLDAIKANRHVA